MVRWTLPDTWPVALRKESVDRNTENAVLFLMTAGSLSARRAWIEIHKSAWLAGFRQSLSARRAWIEIPKTLYCS